MCGHRGTGHVPDVCVRGPGGALECVAPDADHRAVQLAVIAFELGRAGSKRLSGLEPDGAGLHPVLSLPRPQTQ